MRSKSRGVSGTLKIEIEQTYGIGRLFTAKTNLPRRVFSSALALSHVIFFFAVMGGHPKGGAEAMLVYFFDFPGSVPVVLLTNALHIHTPYALYLLLIGGTAWWFCIGILLSKIFTFFSAKGKIRDDSAQQQLK